MNYAAHAMPPEPDLPPPLRGNLTRDQQTRIDTIIAWQALPGTLDGERVSDAKLCKAANLKQPIWSVLKVGNYKVSSEAIDDKIAQLERAVETMRIVLNGQHQQTATAFLETATWRDLKASVEASLELAQTGSDQRLTTLVAPSRHGKTTMSNRLVQLYTGIAINAQIDWKSSRRAVLQSVADKLKVSFKGYASQADLNKAIKAYFATPKLLILNELGPSNVNPWMVAWLRELINDTRAVIVLAGVPELLGYLSSKMRDELEQLELRGRIVHSKPIDAAHVQWFAQRANKCFSDEVAKAIAHHANEFGGYQLVNSLCHLAKPLASSADAQTAAAAFRKHRHIEPTARRAYTRKAA